MPTINQTYTQTLKIASELCTGANVLNNYLSQIKKDIASYRKEISDNEKYLRSVYAGASVYKNAILGGIKDLIVQASRSNLSRHYADYVLNKLSMINYAIGLLINIDDELFMAIMAVLVRDMVKSLEQQEKYYSALENVLRQLYDIVLQISRQMTLAHISDTSVIESAKRILTGAITDINRIREESGPAPNYYEIQNLKSKFVTARNVLGFDNGLVPAVSAKWLGDHADITLSAKPVVLKLYDEALALIKSVKKLAGKDSEYEDITILYNDTVFLKAILLKLPETLKIIKVSAVAFNQDTVLKSLSEKTESITKDMDMFLSRPVVQGTEIQKKEIEYITEIDVELAKMAAFFNSGYLEQLNEIVDSKYYTAIKDLVCNHYYFSDEYKTAVGRLNNHVLGAILGLHKAIGLKGSGFVQILEKVSSAAAYVAQARRQASNLKTLIKPYMGYRSLVLDKVLGILEDLGVENPGKVLYTGDIGYVLNNGLSDVNMMAASVKCVVGDVIAGARSVIGVEEAQSQVSAETMRVHALNTGEMGLRKQEIATAMQHIQELKAKAGIEQWLNL